MNQNYEIIHRTLHSVIYAISEEQVGKLYTSKLVWTDMNGNEITPPFADRNSFDEQIIALRYANEINDLVVKFIEKSEYQGQEMLVMERIYAISPDTITMPEKEQFVNDFEIKLKELNQSGFIHGDIVRPRMAIPACFENIMLTKNGFKLIDTDFSLVLNKENIRTYIYKKMDEENEFTYFKEYFLGVNREV